MQLCSLHFFEMNFLVSEKLSFNILINVTPELNIGKNLFGIFGWSSFRVFEVFIFLESLTCHPVFERCFFREHSYFAMVFWPDWHFDFFLLRFFCFFFRYFLNLNICLLFFCYGRCLVFRKVFLFRIFRLFFSFFDFRLFFDQRFKLLCFDIGWQVHLLFSHRIS